MTEPIIKNWSAVNGIYKAKEELAIELRKFLYSFESKFKQFDWWSGKWHFEKQDDRQIYISNNAWKREDGYTIWIGVENFTDEAIFGSFAGAYLYVWVLGSRHQLASALRDSLKDEQYILGDINSRSYIIKKTLKQPHPEDLDNIDECFTTPILQFFDFYGKKLDDFTRILEEVEKKESQ